MFVNSAMSEGLAGMQQSQKRLQQSAQEIASAGLPAADKNNRPGLNQAPITEPGAAADDLAANNTVNAGTEASDVAGKPGGGVVEPLIEQQRQEHLFNASASVVKVANQTMGRIIDDLS